MERGGMPLYDAVGINCKKGSTTENQGSGVKYMGLGVYLDDCVCVCVFYLTSHDYPSLVQGESHGILLLLLLLLILFVVSLYGRPIYVATAAAAARCCAKDRDEWRFLVS